MIRIVSADQDFPPLIVTVNEYWNLLTRMIKIYRPPLFSFHGMSDRMTHPDTILNHNLKVQGINYPLVLTSR